MFAALLVATTLIASSLATTFGAVANVGVGGGWDPDLTNANGVSGATPDKVSPGKVAGFYLVARNNDSANLSTFFLNASTTATPLGAFWTHDPNATTPVWTACDTSNGLKCTFGAFNSGQAVYVLAAFTLPTGTSTSKTNCLVDPKVKQPANSYGVDPSGATSWVCFDFQFGSNSGYVPGKNNSRGDAYHWFDFVGTDTGQDSAATFPFCNLATPSVACSGSQLSINDAKGNFGKNNPQWTQVKAPPTGAFNSLHASSAIGVADNVSNPCTHPLTDPAECSIAFLGQWSKVDVNDAQDFSPAFIQVDIGIYGVGVNKISHVYHFYEVGTVLKVEVLAKCASNAEPPSGGDPCFWAVALGGNASQVTIWTHFNGKLNIG